MTLIARWALQLTAVFVFGWIANVAAHWSGEIVTSNGSDRLAQLTQERGSS